MKIINDIFKKIMILKNCKTNSNIHQNDGYLFNFMDKLKLVPKMVNCISYTISNWFKKI